MQGHPKASSHARGEWDLLVALFNLLHGSFTLVEAPCGYGEGLILPLKQGEGQHILPRTQVDAGGGDPRCGMGRAEDCWTCPGSEQSGWQLLGQVVTPSPMGDCPLKGAGGSWAPSSCCPFSPPSPGAASSPSVRSPELCLTSERTLGNY